MRLIKSVCAAVALLGAVPASATTTIDFSGVPTYFFTSYTQSGATVTAVGGGNMSVSSSGPNGTAAIIGEAGPRQELRATFAADQGFVSIDLGDFGYDSDLAFLEIFDAGNSSLGFTSLLIPGTDATNHTLSLSGVAIRSAVFGSRAPSLNGSSIYADNLTFGASQPVPEPATWAMMLVGFGAIGGAMRRRRTAQARLVQSA